MSRGKKLQAMEEDVKVSRTAVNANASPAEPRHEGPQGETPGNPIPWEDLGGPTPENSNPVGDSNKLNTPGKTLKQVKDVVNTRKPPGLGSMPMEKGKKGIASGDEVELKDDQEVVSEDEATTEEVVAETETVTDEVVEETVEEYNIEDDVNALLGGEELSEEFKAKAKTIFEAAINSKVATIKEQIQAEYDEKLAEGVAEAKDQLAERVDSYLEYVADEWMQENALAVEAGLKSEMTESFLTGMKSLFEEHYVQIPEEKYDVLESMVEKLDDMETKLNEQIEKNINLNKRLAESVADGILDQVSEGLAATQKEKLASLAEGVEFESDEEYREKLVTLRESYFPTKGAPTAAKTETLSEGVDNTEGAESHSASMSAYLKTLSAFKS